MTFNFSGFGGVLGGQHSLNYRTLVRGTSEPQTGFHRTFRVEPPLLGYPFQTLPNIAPLRTAPFIEKALWLAISWRLFSDSVRKLKMKIEIALPNVNQSSDATSVEVKFYTAVREYTSRTVFCVWRSHVGRSQPEILKHHCLPWEIAGWEIAPEILKVPTIVCVGRSQPETMRIDVLRWQIVR